MWVLIRSSTGRIGEDEFIILQYAGTGAIIRSNPDNSGLELHVLAVGTREEVEAVRSALEARKA